MAEEIQSVDDLQYDWPPNVVNYEGGLIWGLGTGDMLSVGMGAILGMAVHFFLLPVGALTGLLLVKRFAALGDRRIWEYLFRMVVYRARRRPVTLPRILPVLNTTYQLTDLDGVTLVEIEGR